MKHFFFKSVALKLILTILKSEFVDVFALSGEYCIVFFSSLINFTHDTYKTVFSKKCFIVLMRHNLKHDARVKKMKK